MKRQIRKQTITNATQCLNELNNIVKGNGYMSQEKLTAIYRKYHASNNLFYAAAAMGLFSKSGHGEYTVKFNYIEPIQARKVIEYMYDRRDANIVNRSPQIKMPIIHEPAYGQMKNAIEKQKAKQEETEPVYIPQQKTFSLFWGLIKFNY